MSDEIKNAIRAFLDGNFVNNAAINTVVGVEERLRGLVAPSTSIDHALAMFFLKVLSDAYDELDASSTPEQGAHPEVQPRPGYTRRIVVPVDARLQRLCDLRHTPGNGERIDAAFRSLESANPDQLSHVFRHLQFSGLHISNEARKEDFLRQLLEDFSLPALDLRPSQLTRPDAVEHTFTMILEVFAEILDKSPIEPPLPAYLPQLLARLVEPQPGDEICDPVCRTGDLLVACAEHIRLNSERPAYRLYGQDAERTAWLAAKLHLLLCGEEAAHIELGDTLRNPRLLNPDGTLKQFDVVVAAPPFLKSDWGHGDVQSDKFDRFSRGMPPRTIGDYAFILHMIATLKPKTGRLAVLAPHGVLFRRASEHSIRRALIEDNLIDAVIGLPQNLFADTPIAVVLLIIRRNRTGRDVLFIDASNDYTGARKHPSLTAEYVEKVYKAYGKRQPAEGYAYIASYNEIQANDFNLNIPRYVQPTLADRTPNIDALQRKRAALQTDLAETGTRIDVIVDQLSKKSS